MTVQTQAVLHALLADPHAELYGLEIADRTGLLPGSTYPILVRLKQAGWVKDRWELVDPHAERRPRRRYYQLTEDGAVAARTALRTARVGLRNWGLSAGGAT
ncbi:PadR family transcriptional regulator [Umezawaea sp. Da 62-37]|uniref:PadR family transcriptional regulator n=1 Tax=Umezawaea sp. Da 62-37 TaxID=3075927 RepID=UPI0028F73D70|nr:PadR family transcriptional regulator [Umezawaea sp. Da 62-37]WNV84953.1 PadR family transcriptional regulator [Umezawaea sp. Da 62-37]